MRGIRRSIGIVPSRAAKRRAHSGNSRRCAYSAAYGLPCGVKTYALWVRGRRGWVRVTAVGRFPGPRGGYTTVGDVQIAADVVVSSLPSRACEKRWWMNHPMKAVLDWLRSGYPEGVPEKDHFALLAVLRRRLSDDEIDQVVALSVEHAHETPDRHIDYARVREVVAGAVRVEPSEEDMERVSHRLEEGGWFLAQSDSRAGGGCAGDASNHDTHPK